MNRSRGQGMLGGVLMLAVIVCASPALAQKYGGVLKATQRENPPSLSVHEEATISALWPVGPVYNNLTMFNAAHPQESTDDLTAELAEHWAWSKDNTRLTFTLRQGVKWHDGKPFTSQDVKNTFDIVRGVSEKRLRTNPRKLWYENVVEIQTSGDHQVTFVLKHPQPSLLAMLSSGYAPVMPAHLETAEWRTKAIGTGPFRMREYAPDQRIVLEKNPDYFIKGRPYLDGITYFVIKDRTARATALATQQTDIFFPQEGTPAIRDQVRSIAPNITVHLVAQAGNFNVVVNVKRPPFDNLKLRQAVNYALDRHSFLETQQGGVVAGGILIPPPYGRWGLTPAELGKLPGWGDPARDKAQARKLLAESGYGPGHPLQVVISTRATPLYQDMASWMVGELKQVGIEGTLELVDTSLWFSKLARKDYSLGANMMAAGTDDPDAYFLEGFSCTSQRNYSGYCNPEVDALMDRVSQELDFKKRVALAHEVDERLQIEVARSMLGHAVDYVMSQPYVKNYVPHNNIYNYSRMQDVWLDK